MAPFYSDGDYVLIITLGEIRIEDPIVADIEDVGLVLKRVKYIDDSKMILKGDNLRFDSSICNIPLDIDFVVGKVLLNISRLNPFSYFSGKYKRFHI